MNASRSFRTAPIALAVAIAALAVVGCKKKEEPVVAPPAATEPAPTPSITPTEQAPVPTVSVVSVDLGTATGPDLKITAPATTFAPKDKIMASVATKTSDPALSLSSKLTAKWSYQDGQVVSAEPKVITFTGEGAHVFEISMPDGFPQGNYTLEILLNDKVVQTKAFTVQ